MQTDKRTGREQVMQRTMTAISRNCKKFNSK